MSSITLIPTRLHWIKDDGVDDPSDLCAHSPVQMQIDNDLVIDPAEGDVTVSAASIYLLRTLERNHTKVNPVADHLFPCCGHLMYDTGEDDVAISGCFLGSNVYVTHTNDGTVRLETTEDKLFTVSIEDWRDAIVRFSDVVRSFYECSLPKQPTDESDAAGFAKMMSEWDQRRSSLQLG